MVTVKFQRNTHDAEGNYREAECETPEAEKAAREATFSIHMGYSRKAMTFSELVEEHRKYDMDWPDEPFDYSVPDLLRGLAMLIEAGLFKVVEED